MNPPFTSEQFLEVFKNYNQAVFPMQFLIVFLGFLMIYFTIKPNPKSDSIISFLLALFWFWMGIVYHITFFSAINKFANVFGGLFIIQSILFLVFGNNQDKLTFHFKKDIYGITGMILMIFAMIIFPILGYLFGHIYPFSPAFGLPCPTTIFTLGLLVLNLKKRTIWILIFPILWSLIGFTAVFQFGILEDYGLIVAGLISVFLLIYNSKILLKTKFKQK
ncbi:DUF6064 family protein [Flavobacterium sp.]|uniref:DUF6064 family protein n=1 Tax=Flavobacterium sp. TaxID=239 RepID=UPI00286D6B2D|nr:DUF6064 family protein [Flavobacterium sp.]